MVKNIIFTLLAAGVLLAMSLAHAEEQRIVIVTSMDSSIMTISAKEVRRAFLGASIVLDGVEIKPLRNQTDPLAAEVFLQKVLFMSNEVYERQLLALAFRGGNSVKAYEDRKSLLETLQNDSAAITFMLYGTAMTTPGIKIISNP